LVRNLMMIICSNSIGRKVQRLLTTFWHLDRAYLGVWMKSRYANKDMEAWTGWDSKSWEWDENNAQSRLAHLLSDQTVTLHFTEWISWFSVDTGNSHETWIKVFNDSWFIMQERIATESHLWSEEVIQDNRKNDDVIMYHYPLFKLDGSNLRLGCWMAVSGNANTLRQIGNPRNFQKLRKNIKNGK
jgi:hypothetical protein